LIYQLHDTNSQITNYDRQAATHFQQIASIGCPFRHVPQGRAVKLIVGNNQIAPEASRLAILKAIARARLWRDQLIIGEATNVRGLAALNKLNISYIRKLLPLAFLSPGVIEACLNGKMRPDFTLDSLARQFPTTWKDQAMLFKHAGQTY
jgi:site-specific DNA recombinase